MRGWVLVAALGAALLATPMWAQRGGGGGHGGGGGGHGFSGGGGFAGHAGTVSGYHASPGYGGYRGWGVNGWRGNGWYGYPYRYWGGWRGYPYRGYAGSYWYPGWGGYGWYDYPDYYTSDAYPAPPYPPQYDSYAYVPPSGSSASYATQDEVQQIQDEVSQLRAQQAQRYAEPRTTTVLVYRDGHTETVENYAIAGSTLWVFDQNHAKKVPLSDLNLPATKRDNEDRGGEFVVPNAH